MTKKNGWKRVAFAAVTIVAIGGAATVLKPYVKLPWAPAIVGVWASENSVARLDNQLLVYVDLLERATERKDEKAIHRLKRNVVETQRKLDEILLEIKAQKK